MFEKSPSIQSRVFGSRKPYSSTTEQACWGGKGDGCLGNESGSSFKRFVDEQKKRKKGGGRGGGESIHGKGTPQKASGGQFLVRLESMVSVLADINIAMEQPR